MPCHCGQVLLPRAPAECGRISEISMLLTLLAHLTAHPCNSFPASFLEFAMRDRGVPWNTTDFCPTRRGVALTAWSLAREVVSSVLPGGGKSTRACRESSPGHKHCGRQLHPERARSPLPLNQLLDLFGRLTDSWTPRATLSVQTCASLLHAPASTQGGGSAEDEGAGNWTADVLAIALHPSATHCPEVGRSSLEMHTDT